jgi:hypothetical protein
MIQWFDIFYYIEASSLLPNGINPYETLNDFYYKYPPLFYYISTFFGVITDFSYLGPKIMIFFFEILNIWIIYKIGIKLKNKNFGCNIALYYAFNPIIILQFYRDVNEFVTLFFTLLAVYWLIMEKYNLSAISLSLGIGFKLYPIFFLIPITIFFYKNLEKNKIWVILKYYGVALITMLFLSLPFIFLSYDAFFDKLFIHMSRRNIGGSIVDLFPELLILFNPAIEVLGITFSYQFFIQISVLALIFIVFFLTKKNFGIYDVFVSFVIISFTLSLLSYQIQFKYFNLMAFPFLLFILKYNLDKNLEHRDYIFFLINLILTLQFLFYFIIIYPPLSNLFQIYAVGTEGNYNMTYFIGFVLYLMIDYKDFKKGGYQVHLLIVIPIILYDFFDNRLSAIIAVIIIMVSIVYIYFRYEYKKR